MIFKFKFSAIVTWLLVQMILLSFRIKKNLKNNTNSFKIDKRINFVVFGHSRMKKNLIQEYFSSIEKLKVFTIVF